MTNKKHLNMSIEENKVIIDPADDAQNDGGQDEGDEGEDKGDEGEDKGDEGEQKPPEKPIETPEARKARLERQLEQHKKKHPELYEAPKKDKGKKSDELGYGEKAFLIANGIKDADEVALVKEAMENSGKSLEDVLGNRYFQGELKDLRDSKLAADALPNGSKRNGQGARNTVEYWIAKGELPPASERELRTKVVNARLKKETDSNVFTNNPVIQ